MQCRRGGGGRGSCRPSGEECRRISIKTERREDMSQRDMDVLGSTGSIREDVVTLVGSIITESCLTSTILGISERYGCSVAFERENSRCVFLVFGAKKENRKKTAIVSEIGLFLSVKLRLAVCRLV